MEASIHVLLLLFCAVEWGRKEVQGATPCIRSAWGVRGGMKERGGEGSAVGLGSALARSMCFFFEAEKQLIFKC